MPEISPRVSPCPSKIGTILSFLGNFAVDSTLADFLYGITGRKKVNEFVQQKVKGTPLPPPPSPPPLSSNYYKSPWGAAGVIVHDVQEVVKKGQEEAVKLHQICAKSSGATEPFKKKIPMESNRSGSGRNKVFIRSRL
ncbi:hypothetical protein MLD38_010371 [Melastoma candidum]|uniref:Uncharacterized protein n=1 Tax=Melastoma candidum TaxID=119954 RepID=A0ACB9QZL0_9MYRT|nr:hypothetical protein MLD38_010371 [Melastoma candidum]